MAVRLQQQLEQAIAEARDEGAAACLRAQLAILRARMGHAEEAWRELDELRQMQARELRPTLAAWLALARAVVGYYGHRNELSCQPLLRAQALATTARVRPVQALASAWLAHMHYVGQRTEPMVRAIVQVLQEAAPDHHAARSRVSLVIAQNYHYAGRLESAQQWYRRAHEHAAAEGDVATLAALMHNRAWIDVCLARLTLLYGTECGPKMIASLRQTMLSAESMLHLNAHMHYGTDDGLVQMLKAVLLVLTEQPAEALVLFRRYLDAAIGNGMQQNASTLMAERGWCHWQLGDAATARADAEAALATLRTDEHADDEEAAATLAWVARLHEAQGHAEAARALRAEGRRRYETCRSHWLQTFEHLERELAHFAQAELA
ncbi:MAG: hypothetical protein RLZZ598_1416 [Pseudomonadota bacterium]|jgi:tetratricopeptide (TPR) repeat protein